MKSLINKIIMHKKEEMTCYVSSQINNQTFNTDERDALLNRLSDQRQIAFKESNRYFILSIMSSIFYTFKVAGFRFDVLFIGQKLYDSNYGVFLFSSTCLIFFIMAAMRAIDSTMLEQIISAVCKVAFDEASKLQTKSYIDGGIWMSTLMDIGPHVEGRKAFTLFYYLNWFTYGILLFVITIAPIIIGLCVIFDSKNQITGDYQNTQFYIILTLTITASVVGCLTINVNNLDEIEP